MEPVPRVRVAFVDDEATVLTNLRRTMLVMLDEWEMAFFTNGADLLRRLQAESFDVVVTDMRMPDMDGPTVLDEVSARHPEIMRVILTGASDNASIFRTVGPAHIYLPKPCDPAALTQAIRRRMSLRALMDGSEMTQLLDSIAKLPSAPRLFLDLVAELRSPRRSAATVAAIITRDVAMTAGEPNSVAKAAHCAALLAAIGSLVLLNEKSADYIQALEMAGPEQPLHEVETEKFGADHTLIGAYLLGLWGFSDAIIEAITFSGRPSQSGGAVNPVLTALHVARAVGPPFPLLPKNKAEPLMLDHLYLTVVERAGTPGGWRRAANGMAVIPKESA